ncbi:hypothetical protein RHO12_00540 [Orbus sturtevantii]|uniref:DUF6694 family lipoprotein n=1 Tax=Orbus sturtevantii TaxID=3074109 RepID=UPI00370D3D1D
MFKKLLAVLVVSFVLVGCGDSGKTIDFSSKSAMQQSIKEMSEKLDSQERNVFQQSIVKVAFVASLDSNNDEEKLLQLLKSKLGGKTAEEIIKEYGSK